MSGGLSRQALAFAPRLLAIQESPPAPLPRVVLYVGTGLSAVLLVWACFGKLDIITSAEGRLVPQSYVKILQPAEAGIVQDILVRDGEVVKAGQVLLRMDNHEAQANETTLQESIAAKSLRLRRVDAELAGAAMMRRADDRIDLFDQVQAQYADHRRLQRDELARADETVNKARAELSASVAMLAKLREITPLLKQEADAYADLGKDGYVPRTTQQDKQREYLEKAHDLNVQQLTTRSLEAAVTQASRQRDEVVSKYRSELQNERVEAQSDYLKLQQDHVKQLHKTGLLELRAPQAGTVKDLATHTVGTVVSPGTVLLTIVPEHEPLIAEIMVHNDDVGFVREQQTVKLKLAAYPFQKYGMMDGKVMRVSPDATSEDSSASRGREADSNDVSARQGGGAMSYKAVVALDRQALDSEGEHLKLVPGMQVIAEIDQGRRTVMQYLLSPIKATAHDSARER